YCDGLVRDWFDVGDFDRIPNLSCASEWERIVIRQRGRVGNRHVSMRIHHPRWGRDGSLQRSLLGDRKIIGTFGERSCAYVPGTVCLNRRRELGDVWGAGISIGKGDLLVFCACPV